MLLTLNIFVNRKLALFVFIVLLLPNSTLAENPKLNISVNISTYEYADAFVVGDHFYYKINLTNPTTERISDDFSISVYNPHGALIETMKNHKEISIEPGESVEIISKGRYENETAIFPFEIAGDYKIVLESNKSIDFYRWVRVSSITGDKKIIQDNFVRRNKKFEYYFDVMPKWQYNLWKEEEKINKQSIDLNNKILQINIDMDKATQDMNTATKNIELATFVMLAVSLIMLFVATKKR